MTLKLKIEKQPGYLIANFTGEANMPQIGDRFEALAVRCRSAKKTRLLIDCSKVQAAPTFLDRFHVGEKAVVFAEFGIKVALVGPSLIVDPKRLGELVAVNRGVEGRVFTALEEAKQWLLKEPAA